MYSLTVQLVNLIAPIVTLPILARALGSDGMGKIAIVTSVTAYFMIFGSIGLVSFGNRVIAQSNTDGILRNGFQRVFSIQFLYTSVSILLFLLFANFNRFDLGSFWLIILLHLISTYIDFTWFFYGLSDFKTLAIRTIVIRLLSIFLIWILVKESADVELYFLILAISNLISNLTTLGAVKKRIGSLFLNLKFSYQRSDITSSLYIIVPAIIMSVYTNIDRFLILHFQDNYKDVGLYDIGMRFISVFAVLIVSLRPIMITKISENIDNLQKSGELVSRSILLVFYISIPIVFLLFINIDSFIRIFLGMAFVNSSTIVKILAIQILLTGIGDVFVNQVLISRGKERDVLLIISMLCVILTTLYLSLIPFYGVYGAAIGSVVGHLGILFLEYRLASKNVLIEWNYSDIVKLIISGIISGLIVIEVYKFVMVDSYFVLTWVTLLGICVYLFFNYLFNVTFQKYVLNHLRFFIGRK